MRIESQEEEIFRKIERSDGVKKFKGGFYAG
jgi:hypothetical protein